MDPHEASISTGRIVVLSRDDTIPETVEDACRQSGKACVTAPSGYEAAAELLADGADVLVVDFRALGRRHLPLLEIAREIGSAVLAFGRIPDGLSSDHLAEVRLVGRDALADALVAEAAGDEPPVPRPAEPEPVDTEASEPETPEPEASEPEVEAPEHPAAHGGRYVAEPDRPATRAAPSTHDLLTPEELDALFGNES